MIIRRRNNADDRNAISQIYEESWKYAYQGIIPQSYLNSIPKGRWAASVDQAERYSLIMLEDQKMIGITSYCKSRFLEMEGYGEIVSLSSARVYGQGYGKLLFKS